MKEAHILALISNERARQQAKWGTQNHDAYKWLAILFEEAGEAARAALEDKPTDYVDEMIQVTAVAVAAIESMGRVGMWPKEGRRVQPLLCPVCHREMRPTTDRNGAPSGACPRCGAMHHAGGPVVFPHPFAGRVDQDCNICLRPDRDPIHTKMESAPSNAT